MKKLTIATLIACILMTSSSYSYEYEKYVDLSTGTTTFYLAFEDGEIYKHYRPQPIKQKLESLEEKEAIEIAEPSTPAVEEVPEEPIEEPKPVYGDIVLSDEDAYVLKWVLCLEEEGFEEECRVCETIFNRVLSDADWGNTVGEVLAKKHQFSSYRYIDSKKAWDRPGEVEDDVISEVLRETSMRLPSKRYVYFDAKGGVNGKDHVRYGKTTYGRE